MVVNKANQQLMTNSIEMRGITVADMPRIYEMYQNKTLLHLWSPNTEFDSFEQFKAMLNRRLAHRWDHGYVFVSKRENEIIGFGYCYNANEFNKNACACLYVEQAYIGHVFALHISYLYLNHLFLCLNYRKIYAEVYAYNKRCMRLLRHLEFTEEGCLKEHQAWAGKYWDQYIFSMTNTMFDTRRTAYNKLIDRVLT